MQLKTYKDRYVNNVNINRPLRKHAAAALRLNVSKVCQGHLPWFISSYKGYIAFSSAYTYQRVATLSQLT